MEAGLDPFGEGTPGQPDMVNFLLTESDMAGLGWAPRTAPGEIQLALSEMAIAKLEVDLAVGALAGSRQLLALYADNLLAAMSACQQIEAIIWQAGAEQIAIQDRLEEMALAEAAPDHMDTWDEGAVWGLKLLGDCEFDAKKCAAKLLSASGLLIVDELTMDAEAAAEQEKISQQFDIEKEKIQIQTWADASIAAIECQTDASLTWQTKITEEMIQTPQLMVNLAIAQENFLKAAGQFAAAAEEGKRVRADLQQLREIQQHQIQQHRWKDLAFRVFRNNALDKYRSFFDLAARYVALAAQAFAYEYSDRALVEETLEGFHRELRLGNPDFDLGSGGLWGVIHRARRRGARPSGLRGGWATGRHQRTEGVQLSAEPARPAELRSEERGIQAGQPRLQGVARDAHRATSRGRGVPR